MDKIIEQLVTDAVREGLHEEIAAIVASKLEDKMGDESFTEKVDKIATEKFKEAITPVKEPEPKYKSVGEFVDDFIRPMWATTRNDQDTVNWSSKWYEHREAVSRLSALWRIYEIQRKHDPERFLEKFLRVHADYHMRQLMAEGSVFSRCSSTDTASVPLPVIPAAKKGGAHDE